MMLRLPAACCRVDLAWTMLCLAPRAHRVRFPNVRALCVERFIALYWIPAELAPAERRSPIAHQNLR